MIKKLSYQEIDFEKYELCLNKAIQNSDYAHKNFLDLVVEDTWELLIYNDYEAILPVPILKKMGVKFVIMPKLCQQLGVFSSIDKPEINDLFFNFLNKNYNILSYSFNKANKLGVDVPMRKSYFISKNEYEIVKKKYSVHRRRNVRIVGNIVGKLEFSQSLLGDEKEFFLKNAKGISNLKQQEIYFSLFENLYKNGFGKVLTLRIDGEIESFIFLYQTSISSYLSLFVNKEQLYNSNIPSIMIDECLKNYVNEKDFDFMGSNVDNVAKFNERFGAISYEYPCIINSKLSLLKKLVRLANNH